MVIMTGIIIVLAVWILLMYDGKRMRDIRLERLNRINDQHDKEYNNLNRICIEYQENSDALIQANNELIALNKELILENEKMQTSLKNQRLKFYE
jgi:regulator of PEP synthase PpsR (kinase-PPPase family)